MAECCGILRLSPLASGLNLISAWVVLRRFWEILLHTTQSPEKGSNFSCILSILKALWRYEHGVDLVGCTGNHTFSLVPSIYNCVKYYLYRRKVRMCLSGYLLECLGRGGIRNEKSHVGVLPPYYGLFQVGRSLAGLSKRRVGKAATHLLSLILSCYFAFWLRLLCVTSGIPREITKTRKI